MLIKFVFNLSNQHHEALNRQQNFSFTNYTDRYALALKVEYDVIAKTTVTNKQICLVRIIIVSMISVIYCFYFAVIILFVNLELSRF